MRRFSKMGIFIILIFAIMMTLATGVSARSIKFSQNIINANINSDGSVDVEEWVTYDFSGKYNGIYQDIGTNKSSGIENLFVFRASSNNISEANLEPLTNTNLGSRETCEAIRYSDYVRVKVYTPSENTQKTYVFRYKIKDATKKYNDVGEFYWQFISKTNETSNENVQITITVPDGSKKGDLRVFGHGPLTGKSEILDDRTVRLSIDYLPAKTMLEARVLFSPSLISDGYYTENKDMLPSILQEEGKWANDANSIRNKFRSGIQHTKDTVGSSFISSWIFWLILLVIVYVVRITYNFV
jgi:uncharacterized membrane protein